MNRTTVLLAILAVGCQEYTIDEPDDGPEISNVPPTVYPPEPDPPTPPVPTEPEVPVAEAPVYANTSGELFTVEPDTGTRTSIGLFRDVLTGAEVTGFFDIAIDSQGGVFGGTDEGIFRIDPETAQVERICDSSTRPLGMAFTPDDRLLVAGDRYITHMNLGNCQENDVVVDTPYFTSGDIVNLPDGFIYWTVEENDHEDGLVRIDPSDWSLSYVGLIPFSGLFGIGYADGQLFGFSRYGDTVAISPTAGPNGYVATTALRNDEGFSWWGATTNPVAWGAE